MTELTSQKEDVEKNKQELEQLSKEQAQKRRDLNKYVIDLKKTHPDLAALLGAEPVELVALQEKLPEKTVILQYLLLPDKIIIFVIGKGSLEIVEAPGTRKNLEAKVNLFRKLIVSEQDADAIKLEVLSKELYTMLIEPVDKAGGFKNADTVGISPNQFLHYLPFCALKGSKGYLVDRYKLFYINSTSILSVAADRASGAGKGEEALMAFGNPDGTLEGAEKEVDEIGKNFSKKNIYIKGKAVKSAVVNKQQETILHFATHGSFDSQDSRKSYLIMADSKLTVEEIWGLPLNGTRLTVLSACETGLGNILSGDDVISLENAFIYAGCPTVVASLCSVSDEATLELMTQFYSNLAKGMDKASAMAEAQRRVRQNKDFAHPFFWAAFTVRGCWK